MRTETITAMILASFVGYFAGGVFEQATPVAVAVPQTSVIHDAIQPNKMEQVIQDSIKPTQNNAAAIKEAVKNKESKKDDTKKLKSSHVLGNKLGISEETHMKLTLSPQEVEFNNQQARERLLRDQSNKYKAYNGKRGKNEEISALDLESLPPPEAFNTEEKPTTVVASVNDLESLLNNLAESRGKSWNAARVRLNESELKESHAHAASLLTSPLPPLQFKEGKTLPENGGGGGGGGGRRREKRGRGLNYSPNDSARIPSPFNEQTSKASDETISNFKTHIPKYEVSDETGYNQDNDAHGNHSWKLRYPRMMQKDVFALHDVCIEKHPHPWVEVKTGSCPHRPDKSYNINRRIVVYNSPKGPRHEKEMTAAGHGNRKNLWEIFYEPGPIPPQYKYADYPAIFTTTSCEANLHHFLVDQLSRIYGVMKDVGRLGSSDKEEFERMKVALFYRDDVHDFCRDTGCHDPTKFEELLFTLPIISHRAYFTDNNHLGVCFRDAILGTHRQNVRDSQVSSHIVKGLENKLRWEKGDTSKAPDEDTKNTRAANRAALTGKCPTDPDRTVLILQRKSRKLLNAEDLARIVRSKGLYANVVEFEGASVMYQLTTVRCCKLFIGVMGAGQQWVSFMRPRSTLLSIGWTNWKASYYEKYARDNNVNFFPVITDDIYPNFESPTIVKHFGKDKLQSEAFRRSIMTHKQVAKNCDVKLPEKDLNAILRNVFKV